MVDRETQTSHQHLIDLIEEEWEVQLEKQEMHLYNGNDAAADEVTNVDLPRLDRIYEWLLADKEKAKIYKWRKKTVRVFNEAVSYTHLTLPTIYSV